MEITEELTVQALLLARAADKRCGKCRARKASGSKSPTTDGGSEEPVSRSESGDERELSERRERRNRGQCGALDEAKPSVVGVRFAKQMEPRRSGLFEWGLPRSWFEHIFRRKTSLRATLRDNAAFSALKHF
jgi:hypothetical protein